MRVAALLAVTLVLAGCSIGGTKTTAVTVTRTVTTSAGTTRPPAAQYFGAPVSLTKLDAKRYALAIKPELFLSGVTANVAFAAEQENACQPLECPAVDDDHWVIPAGTRNLLFILPAKTTGTVLTLSGPELQIQTTKITVAQLSAIVGGAKTPKLFEPLESGLWLTVDGDTVTSFSQQYQP